MAPPSRPQCRAKGSDASRDNSPFPGNPALPGAPFWGNFTSSRTKQGILRYTQLGSRLYQFFGGFSWVDLILGEASPWRWKWPQHILGAFQTMTLIAPAPTIAIGVLTSGGGATCKENRRLMWLSPPKPCQSCHQSYNPTTSTAKAKKTRHLQMFTVFLIVSRLNTSSKGSKKQKHLRAGSAPFSSICWSAVKSPLLRSRWMQASCSWGWPP